MDTIRWILLVAGVALVVVIYVWGRSKERRESRSRDYPDPLDDAAPAPDFDAGMRSIRDELEELGEIIAEEGGDDKGAGSAGPASTATDTASPAMEKLVTLFVVLPRDNPLAGSELLAGLRDIGLSHGDMDIYHRRQGADGPAIFSVANLVEPGTLNASELEGTTTPGVVFFLRLPGPVDGWTALDDMVGSANRLAERIGARVLDDGRNPLTRQAVEHLRQEIGEFQRRRRLALHTA